MEFIRKSLTLLSLIGLLFVNYFAAFAQTGESGVSLEVTGVPAVCDNDGICDAGETVLNCPADCGCNSNGICQSERGENEANCTVDCGCNNNGICQPARGENSSNCPVDCVIVGGPIIPPDVTAPAIYNISVFNITLNSADISWETDEFALCQLSFGRTQEYEAGILSEVNYYQKHLASLRAIAPGTLYHFKIACRDGAANESETPDQEFITLFPPDIAPPANVSNFTAKAGDRQIELDWVNPPEADFKGVKIVRSTNFYLTDPNSGVTVYNGAGKNFTDMGLENGVRYYYTAFAYDKAGNYSSGAIVSGVPHKPGVIPPPEEIPTSTIPITPEIEKLNFDDFDFFQQGEKIIPREGKFDIKSGFPLTASIAYQKMPEVLKTIMVTLEESGGKIFSFLLRINKEKTRYEAVIASPEPGQYPLTLNILDYKNQSLKTLKGELVITGEKTAVKKTFCQKWGRCLILILLIIIAIIIAIYLARKRKNKKLAEVNRSYGNL